MGNKIKAYSTIGSVSKATESGYVNIGGVWKPIVEAYDNIGGVWKSAWETGGTRIGDLAVGSSVWFAAYDGELQEWIVVHQGNPDTSKYDSAANGTWLLSKVIFNDVGSSSGVAWGDTAVGGYASSGVYQYMAVSFHNTVPQNILSKIYSISPPCGGTAESKFFPLSSKELGGTGTNYGLSSDGTTLSYFIGADDTKRQAKIYKSTSYQEYFTRSTNETKGTVVCVAAAGTFYARSLPRTTRNRPACVMDSNTLVDGTGNIIV